jgi:hypothetical protein
MSTKEQITRKDEPKIGNKTKISACDLTKANTAEILQKMEFQVPVLLQGYTDLFTKYLHSFNITLGACRTSEKQFFDKFGIDHTIMEEIAEYWNFVKNLTIIQIESHSKFIQDYIEFRISTMDSFDKSLTSAFDYYAKALSEFNKK